MRPDVCRAGFEVAAKEKQMKELEAQMGAPDFWRDRAAAEEKIKTFGELKAVVDRFRDVERGIAALTKEYRDDVFFDTRKKFRELELEELFKGAHDKQAAVLSVYPGAGGEDAGDWARMLFEMYMHYAEGRGWAVTLLDENPNRRTCEIRGAYAYGYLRREAGVHRLVRISPFSAQKLRHTSFALVEVAPDLPAFEESKIQIPEKDLKIEFSRSSGPGGQNVNKVETAVRIVHLPTGISAGSQVERSQAQNRERAMKLLKAKIFQEMQRAQVKELESLRTKVKPEWGNQIRSYVLNPYQLVKDHRTEAETSRVDEVLAGDLDKFIEAEVELLP